MSENFYKNQYHRPTKRSRIQSDEVANYAKSIKPKFPQDTIIGLDAILVSYPMSMYEVECLFDLQNLALRYKKLYTKDNQVSKIKNPSRQTEDMEEHLSALIKHCEQCHDTKGLLILNSFKIPDATKRQTSANATKMIRQQYLSSLIEYEFPKTVATEITKALILLTK